MRDQNTRNALTYYNELNANEKITKVVVRKMDKRMVAIVSRELVAVEDRCLRFWYRLCT